MVGASGWGWRWVSCTEIYSVRILCRSLFYTHVDDYLTPGAYTHANHNVCSI